MQQYLARHMYSYYFHFWYFFRNDLDSFIYNIASKVFQKSSDFLQSRKTESSIICSLCFIVFSIYKVTSR